jgi:hypothetical protein
MVWIFAGKCPVLLSVLDAFAPAANFRFAASVAYEMSTLSALQS